MKRIPQKYLVADYLCFSQPLQSSHGSRTADFCFDEYHTIIQCDIYENKSWFYNRSCIGRAVIPVFAAKKQVSQVWVELSSCIDEREDNSNTDSDVAILSDDEVGPTFKFSSPIVSPRKRHRDVQISDEDNFSLTTHSSVKVRVEEPPIEHFQRKTNSNSLGETSKSGTLFRGDPNPIISDGELEEETRGRLKSKHEKEQKSRSAPTSPKRRRDAILIQSNSSISHRHKSMNQDLSIPTSSNPLSLTHSPLSPASISRPSSPINSPSSHGDPILSSIGTGYHVHFDTYHSKHKSTEIKLSGLQPDSSHSPSWLSFLSSSSPTSNECISHKTNRTIKRALFQVTMNPVNCSVQDFEIVASISRGAFHSPNQLFLVKDKDSNNPLFMKIVPIVSNSDEELLYLEGSKETVAYSTSLRWQLPPHPFIVDLHTTFQTDNKLYLLMEWLGGGELFWALRRTRQGRFEENEVLFYTAQIILALESVHHHKIIYRDLKPENLLLSADGNLKITVRTPPESWWEGSRQNFTIITGHSLPEYLAPEILKGQPATIKADSWSVGTIMYHMLVGQPPFLHANIQSLISSIINEEVEYPDFLSANAVSLLKGLLNKDARKRFTLKTARHHEFFEGLDWHKMLRKEYLPPITPCRRQDLYFNISKHQQNKKAADEAAERDKLLSTTEVPPSASRHMSL